MNRNVCGNLILSFLLLSLIACGRQYENASIPGASGRYSSVTSDYPGVVLVLAPLGRGMCSGNIVSEYAVLTAAHCLLTPGEYTVRTSTGEFTTSTVRRFGPGVVDDPRDIGLLIFEEAITSGSGNDVYGFGSQASEGSSVTLVGYGCNSREARSGAGTKRVGTNTIAEVSSEYISLLTPVSSSSSGRGLIGDYNQTGTCFGDSGSGLLQRQDGRDVIIGVTHAGGTYGRYYVSEFTNVATFDENREWLSSMNSTYGLGIQGL